MLTLSGRRYRGLALVALALVGLPAAAEAQLFPNLPIRRQRPDCAQERPDYRYVRHEYFGYYPTCWRRFPPGWGCPSAEAPNSAAAMEEIKREAARAAQSPPGEQPDEAQPTDENAMPAQPTLPEGEVPALPNQVSPFNLNRGDPANRPGNPPGGATPENPPPGSGVPSPRASAPESSSDQPEAPSLSANDDPAAPLALLDVGNPSSPPTAAPVPAPDTLPFPGPPEPTTPPGASPRATAPTLGAFPQPPTAAPAPVQAPQRRSLLGGLFQGLRRRR
jgi:hypothetical protein